MKSSRGKVCNKTKDWEIPEVKADLSQEIKNSDGLKTTIQLTINMEGNITQEQKDELLKQTNACKKHRQIMGEWNIEKAS